MRLVDNIFNSMLGKSESSPYIDCDYLECDSNGQYIDTGVYISTSLRIISKVGGRDGHSNISPFAGRDSAGVKSLLLRLKSDTPGYNGYITGALGSNTQQTFGVFVPDEIYDVDINGKTWSITNSQGVISSHTFSVADFTSTIRTMYLFGFNLTDTANSSSGTIIGSTSIYDNGTLIRDYRPKIRREDGVTGFYDVVNDTFNPSANGINFLYGNF